MEKEREREGHDGEPKKKKKNRLASSHLMTPFKYDKYLCRETIISINPRKYCQCIALDNKHNCVEYKSYYPAIKSHLRPLLYQQYLGK